MLIVCECVAAYAFVVDTERIVVRYSNMFALLRDLKGMGESGATWRRADTVSRQTLVAASAIYQEMFPAEPHPDAPDEIGERLIDITLRKYSMNKNAQVLKLRSM